MSSWLDTKITYHFTLEILAPNGLNGIENAVNEADIGLHIWRSGANQKNILRSHLDCDFEFDMDTSDNDVLFASGDFECNVEEAKHILLKLSNILKAANYPHRVGMDNEAGFKLLTIDSWVTL